MKTKKLILLLIFILIIILILLFIVTKNFDSQPTDKNTITQEYTPEEEISSTQMRETIVTLYFFSPSTNELKSEGKLVDSATLLQNPYKKLIELLLEGPQSESLTKIIPDNTQILDATIESNCVTLNFSQELLNYEDDNQKYNIINSLLNTLIQLNEVNSVKILINNEVTDDFNEEYSMIH